VTQNPFGKIQSDQDVKAEEIIQRNLHKSGVVYGFVSEETPQLNVVNEDGDYIVTYDPIDGSLVTDANFSVATIFCVWRARSILGLSG